MDFLRMIEKLKEMTLAKIKGKEEPKIMDEDMVEETKDNPAKETKHPSTKLEPSEAPLISNELQSIPSESSENKQDTPAEVSKEPSLSQNSDIEMTEEQNVQSQLSEVLDEAMKDVEDELKMQEIAQVPGKLTKKYEDA